MITFTLIDYNSKIFVILKSFILDFNLLNYIFRVTQENERFNYLFNRYKIIS